MAPGFVIDCTLQKVYTEKPMTTEEEEQGRFSINVGNSDEEISLHMDCRFNYLSERNIMVCNSCQWGKWDEEKRENNFPFAEGRLFEIKINFIGQEFVIILQNGTVIRFPNRLGADNYRYLKFKDDVQIQSIEIK